MTSTKLDVIIRPLTNKDAKPMAKLANNIKIAENLRDGFPYPYKLEDAKTFVNKFKDHKLAYIFAIEFNGKYDGNIGLVPETDVYRKSAELGYFIGEPYWNKRVTTKAINLICNFGFQNLEILRIECGVFEYNLSSQRILENVDSKKKVFSKKPYLRKVRSGMK